MILHNVLKTLPCKAFSILNPFFSQSLILFSQTLTQVKTTQITVIVSSRHRNRRSDELLSTFYWMPLGHIKQIFLYHQQTFRRNTINWYKNNSILSHVYYIGTITITVWLSSKILYVFMANNLQLLKTRRKNSFSKVFCCVLKMNVWERKPIDHSDYFGKEIILNRRDKKENRRH